MAFIQDVGFDAPTASGATRGASGAPSAAIGVSSRALDLAGTIFQKKDAKERDSVIADAIGGISNLEQERESLLAREADVQSAFTGLYADAEITEDEQETLAQLQQEQGFLRQARENGILNNRQFSTRYNSLLRESLGRAENLGIQSNIQQLFDSRRSALNAPLERSPEQQAIIDNMDAIHGKDNWTQEQAGEWAGKRQWAAGVINTTGSSPAEKLDSYRTITDDSFQALFTDKKNGSLISDDERGDFIVNLNTVTSQYINKINEQKAELRKRGVNSGRAFDSLEKAQQAITERHTFYTDDVWKQESVKGRDQLLVMKNALASENTWRELNKSPTLKGLQALGMGSGGGLGASGSQGLVEFLHPDNKGAEVIFSAMAESEGLGRSWEDLRTDVLRSVTSAADLALTPQQSVDGGIWDHNLLRIQAVVSQRKPAVDKEDATLKVKSVSSFKAVVKDQVANIQNLEALTKQLPLLAAEANKHGVTTELRNSTLSTIKSQALELEQMMGAVGIKLTQDADGVISLTLPARGDGLKTPEEQAFESPKHSKRLKDSAAALTRSLQTAHALNLVTKEELVMFEGQKAEEVPAIPVSEVVGQTEAPDVADVRSTVAWEENRTGTGLDKATGLWTPHTSIEGGTDTLAFGHKLTNEEVKSGKITLRDGAIIDFSKGITQEQAAKLLDSDLAQAREDARALLGGGEIDQDVEDVVTKLSFQMGKERLGKFKDMLKALNNGDLRRAAMEILINGDGTDLSDLAKVSPERAKRLAKQLLGAEGELEPGDTTPQALMTLLQKLPAGSTREELIEFLTQKIGG